MLVGGDFNIIRRQEKHNDNFNARGSFLLPLLKSRLDRIRSLMCTIYIYRQHRQHISYTVC